MSNDDSEEEVKALEQAVVATKKSGDVAAIAVAICKGGVEAREGDGSEGAWVGCIKRSTHTIVKEPSLSSADDAEEVKALEQAVMAAKKTRSGDVAAIAVANAELKRGKALRVRASEKKQAHKEN